MTEIVLLSCSILIGFLCGLYLRKRTLRQCDFFCDLKRYTSALQLNVTGKQLELKKFNDEFAENCSEAFREFLSEHKLPGLSAQQKKMVQTFFDNLDCTSGSQLLQHLQFYEKQFETDLKDCDEIAKKSSMYIKLGLLMGAMVGILFL